MSTEKGKIKVIGQTQTFGSNGFRKRELVIETFSQYPQTILFEFIQDKVDLLDSLKVGQTIEVSYNLNGREWVNPQGETKYFNSIVGWRIEAVAEETQAQEQPIGNEQDVPF